MANLAGDRSINNLADLPHDLHLKIISLIASVSITDLFNVTRTCKSLYEAGTHSFVLRNSASWGKFYAIHTRKLETEKAAGFGAGAVILFVLKFITGGDPEAMLCLQMEEYFFGDEKKKEEAVRRLKTADAEGHVAAKLVYRVICLMAGGGAEDEEFGVVREMIECSRAGKFMIDCVRASVRINGDDSVFNFDHCFQGLLCFVYWESFLKFQGR